MPDARTRVAQHLSGIIHSRSKNEGEAHHGGLSPPKPPTTGGRGGGWRGGGKKKFYFDENFRALRTKNLVQSATTK